MSRFTKAISAPKVNIALFVIAALLLIVAGVGGTRAALTYFSDSYVARIAVSDIGVTLLENGQEVAYRNYDGNDKWNETPGPEHIGTLLGHMDGASFKVGYNYKEEIAVKNTGTIGQYVRVSILKYWEKPDGNGGYTKVRTVSPSLINLAAAKNSDWVVDGISSTDERTVYYYTKPLAKGETSSALSSTLSVSKNILTKVTQSESTEMRDGKEYTVITTTYDYDGLRFCLEAEVDAVQEHNAKAAIRSAWGKNVNISKNGKLGLA